MTDRQHAPIAIINGDVFDGNELLKDHAVVASKGLIQHVVPNDEIPSDIAHVFDIDGCVLLPGFIDIQVNGGGGALFNDEPTVETLRTISAAHRLFGTTGLLPTIITDDLSVMSQAIAAVKQAIDESVPGILGIHLEGPFISFEKSGIHSKSKIREIDEFGLQVATSLSIGKTLMTVAPERIGSDAIGQLVKGGVIVWAGHSAATYSQARSAIDAGVSGFTHLFNAMSPMHSREPGMVGAALEHCDGWFGIIADGHHVHPATFGIAVRSKKRGGAILVTDAMPSVGTDCGSFELGGETISVVDGRCTNSKGVLAGSDLDMIHAVNNAAAFAKIDWYEAVRMATSYPAQALGLSEKYGYIKPGFVASMVAVNSGRMVVQSWVEGEAPLA